MVGEKMREGAMICRPSYARTVSRARAAGARVPIVDTWAPQLNPVARANAEPYRLGPRDMARDRIRMGHKGVRSVALLAGLCVAAACAPGAPHKAADPAHPTIVSLNPCLDAILVEVAPPEQVLALSHYSRDPGSSSIPAGIAARFGVTGGTAEEVIAAQPDLVLASIYLPQPTRSALERAGLTVATFGSPTSVAESTAQVREVAALAGRVSAGEALAGRIAAPPARPRGTIDALLWQPGEIVAGEQTLIAELLREEGFASHAARRGLRQADGVSLESVLADPPSVLLVAGDAPGQRHPLLAGAFKSMHIAAFDPSLIYCVGPTIPKARARLRQIRAQWERRP